MKRSRCSTDDVSSQGIDQPPPPRVGRAVYRACHPSSRFTLLPIYPVCTARRPNSLPQSPLWQNDRPFPSVACKLTSTVGTLPLGRGHECINRAHPYRDRREVSRGRLHAVPRHVHGDSVVRNSALIVCRPDLVVGRLTPGGGGLPMARGCSQVSCVHHAPPHGGGHATGSQKRSRDYGPLPAGVALPAVRVQPAYLAAAPSVATRTRPDGRVQRRTALGPSVGAPTGDGEVPEVHAWRATLRRLVTRDN